MDLTSFSSELLGKGNASKVKPDQCYTPLNNYTSSLANYDAIDGGIPLTFGLNCLGWLLIIVLFMVIRKLVWDYGRLALVQKEDEGWVAMFYGQSDEDKKSSDPATKPSVQFPEIKDKGFFSWIPVLFKVRDEHIHLKCGVDALEYISFQKHLILFSVIILCFSIGIVLPVNFSGTNEPFEGFGKTTVSNLGPNSSLFWLHTVFGISYLVIMVAIMRNFLSKFCFDKCSDSSNTVMISNIPKTVHSDQIKQHFVEIYSESKIVEVQMAYNFKKLATVNKKLEAAQLGKEHCQELLVKTGEQQQTIVGTSKVSPCWPCCGAMHVDGNEYFTEEEENARAEVDELRQSLKRIGIAFVTFSSEQTMQRCLQDFNTIKHNSPESSVSRKIFSDHWSVAVAPAPGNIIWENLSIDPEQWWIRSFIINAMLFFFVLFFTTPTVFLTSFEEIKASVGSKKSREPAEPASAFVSQFIPTILLWTFSALLPTVVSYSSYFEAHWTRSKQEHSIMIKTYIFLMLMVLVLPSLALTSADALFQLTLSGNFPSFQSKLACVFLPNNGAFFVNYLVTSALIGTALELCRFPELVSFAARMSRAKDDGEKRLVRQEAVIEFAYGQQYAWMIMVFSVMVVFSISCPLVTPFGLLYMVMKHIVDRYNLYFNYRAPAYKYGASVVHETAVTFTLMSTFLLMLCLLFYSIIRLGMDDPQTIFTLVIVVAVIVIFVAKTCFGVFKRFGPQKHDKLATGEEGSGVDIYIPEAYLPPALRTSRDRKSSTEDRNPPQLTRRRNYGTTSPTAPGQSDHVIDASQLSPSTETVIHVTDEEKH